VRTRRVTLQDVADQAGVNRVTASVALGRSPRGGTRVSETTRQRVLEVAEYLGYTPNAIARALRGERTHIIGYYAGYESLDAHSPFTAAILQGLQGSCRLYNQDLMLFGSFERDTIDDIYATLASGKLDGLILLPTPNSPIMDRLYDSHLPVMAIANSHPSISSVVIDDVAGSKLLVDYLFQKGHRRLLYRSNSRNHGSTARRLSAFLDAAAAYNMSVIITDAAEHREFSDQESAILNQPIDERPTAAACWMDLSAYTLLAKCNQLGLHVPDDMAIVGFDGVPLSVKPMRALTTIRAPWAEVAAKAVELLLALLNGEEVSKETMLPVELVIGDTA
jgi:DNA-binding LacI/PurR family transcriptional regulator